MKGGLSKIKYKTNRKLFYEFSLRLITDTIITNLPKIKYKNKQSGGNFVDDFTSWIKINADPIHDFKMEHLNFDKSISEKLLIRLYNDILIRTPIDYENSVLIKLLQDPNTDQGISLKYCRFYIIEQEEDDIIIKKNLWENIETEYDKLDENVRIKFYILNASIKGTGSRDFTQEYKKIIPASVYWDPFKASSINFNIINNLEFYSNLYDDICKELYYATKIKFIVNEGDNDKQILLSIQAPNNSVLNYKLNRQGFSINEIKKTIDELNKNLDISIEELKDLINFLQKNGSNNNDIISFLLICKMSGDIGCVYFIKSLDTYNGLVLFNNKEIDYNVTNKPITFLYTSDRLCGACAIANNVKCVVTCKPLTTTYICQYVGSEGIFNESIYEPYYDILEEITGTNFRILTQEQKDYELFVKFFNIFIVTFPDLQYEIKQEYQRTIFSQEVSRKLQFIEEPIKTDDDRIKHILAIIAMNDIKKNLNTIISYIIKTHLSNQKVKWDLISLNYLKILYKKYNSLNLFDPLLQFFMNTLIIPNETIKEFIYKYIIHEIEINIGISLTKNYRSLMILYDYKKSDDKLETYNLDTGMLDVNLYKDDITVKKTSKIKQKKLKKYEDDPDYIPS